MIKRGPVQFVSGKSHPSLCCSKARGGGLCLPQLLLHQDSGGFAFQLTTSACCAAAAKPGEVTPEERSALKTVGAAGLVAYVQVSGANVCLLSTSPATSSLYRMMYCLYWLMQCFWYGYLPTPSPLLNVYLSVSIPTSTNPKPFCLFLQGQSSSADVSMHLSMHLCHG